jgi:hypothetical protein
MNLEADFLRFVNGRCHEGKEEEKEEEERIIVYHSSWNCSVALDWSIRCPRFYFGGTLQAPTRLASATDGPSTSFWACRASGGSRYETNTARHVFDCTECAIAVERSMIYLAFVAATVVLCVLVAVAHRKLARETSAQRLTMTGENNAGTRERKNVVHPLMHV